MDLIINAFLFVSDSALDVAPIVFFLFVFQLFVMRERIRNVQQVLVGFVFVTVGLGLFLVGLEQTLFPLGRLMAQQLTNPEFLLEVSGHIGDTLVWQDFYWVYLFAAAIGFSTTLAEPALMAVSIKANSVSGGAVGVWGACCGRAWCGLRRRAGLLPNNYGPAAAIFYCGRLCGRHRTNGDGAQDDHSACL